jgi:hypothetical protein
MRILYVGPTLDGSTSLQRLQAMRALGHRVEELRSTDLTQLRQPWHRLGLKLGLAADLDGVNAALVDRVRRAHWNLVWLDKPISIRPETLMQLRRLAPELPLAAYTPDDMFIMPNRTQRFIGCLPAFDVFFTTKPHNVGPLQRLGAGRVVLVANAYAEETHRPWTRNATDRAALGGEIGFVGDYEEARRTSIAALARAGLAVRVWGPNWRKRWRHPPPGVRIEGRGLSGNEYARAICHFDINLAFLRKAARDEITTRSMEIPACGGFMLAERTAAHQATFEEGREAVFFAGDDELVRHCWYYSRHPDAAQQIGLRGRERCLRDGYGNREQMHRMLSLVWPDALSGGDGASA